MAPDCTKEEEEELLKRIQGNIEKARRGAAKNRRLGRAKARIPDQEEGRGHYYFFLLNMDEGTVSTMDSFYRTMDLVLRHMFVVVDEKDKGLEKPPEPVVFDETEGEA